MRSLRLVSSISAAGLVAGAMVAFGPVTAAFADTHLFEPIQTGPQEAQDWTVPAGVTKVLADGIGGGGGCPAVSSASGGAGANVVAGVPVEPGTTLSIYVGTMGSDGLTSTSGGFPNGGAGGTGTQNGAGGGGSTEIRDGSQRLFVAAGGGGCSPGGIGYSGGNGANDDDQAGGSGEGSTATAGGGGANESTVGDGGIGQENGSQGSPTMLGGHGGGGGSLAMSSAGGGGGGGYAGGGGGAANLTASGQGAGGAGSSFAPAGASYNSLAGMASDGEIRLTWIVIGTDSLAPGEVGEAYQQPLSATATGDHDIEWSVLSGELPAGLGIDPATQAITGTPTDPGAYAFTLQASDTGGQMSSQQDYLIMVAPKPANAPSVTTGTAVASSNSVSLHGSVTPNGAIAEVSFSYATTPSLAGATTIAANPTLIGANAEATPVSAVVTGLVPGTTYYYRANANNGTGGWQSGAVSSFTTSRAEQVPNGCGTLPKRLKKNKKTVLLPKTCRTNAGQKLTVAVTAKRGSKKAKAQVVRTAKGKVSVKTGPKRATYKVTLAAAPTPQYTAFSATKTYKA